MEGAASSRSVGRPPRSNGLGSSRSGGARRPLRFAPPTVPLPPTMIHFTKPETVAPVFNPTTSANGNGTSAENGPTAVAMMTDKLLQVFTQCNGEFFYDRRLNPRRVLTKPSQPTYNSGFDNERHDYILYVNDVLGNEEGRRYVILDLLGHGTFGQVVKCQNVKSRELVAVKVIKNQAAFFNQSMMEVTVLEMLNQRYDREDKRNIIRMRDTFVFRQHLCIVVELLSLNLYDLIKQNQFRGFSLTLCRLFLIQILDAMKVLKEARIIHCDLKPENILLRNLESPSIKVIDFGSACHEHQTLYTYIQSRFYRSPEVLLGLPYSSAIDMWSLGCIAAELFLGLPVFPGASNYDQISRIVATLGLPPTHMLEVGKDSLTYFERTRSADGRNSFKLKSRERYCLDTNRLEAPPKQYFTSTVLEEIIMNYPIRPKDLSQREKDSELANRRCFMDFVKGLLNLNPIERWSPYQASQHPFLTGRPFAVSFIPPTPIPTTVPIPSTSEASRVPVALQSRQRPRANTLSSLSLQDIPAPIQRVAANREKDAPGVGPIERMDKIPDAEELMRESGGSESRLPFDSGSFSREPAIHASHAHKPHESMNSISGFSPPNSIASGNTERISSYASNRRVSQPVIQGIPTARYMVGRSAMPGSSNVNVPGNSGNNTLPPSSMPNAVWYGPEPTFGMSPNYNQPSYDNNAGSNASVRYTTTNKSTYYSNTRRNSGKGEMAVDGPSGVSANPNARSPKPSSPLSGNNVASTSSRRASVPNIAASAEREARNRRGSALNMEAFPSTTGGEDHGIIFEQPGRRRDRASSTSSSTMDIVDELEDEVSTNNNSAGQSKPRSG